MYLILLTNSVIDGPYGTVFDRYVHFLFLYLFRTADFSIRNKIIFLLISVERDKREYQNIIDY